MARRVRLDVRWDEEDVAVATAAAVAMGVRPAVAMRLAVKLGLACPEFVALRARGERQRGGSAAAAGMMAGASSAAPSPRPELPAAPPSVKRVKLAVAVAAKLAQAAGRAPVVVDVTRARAKIAQGRVRVDGEVVRDPNMLVDPALVTS